MTQVFLTKKNFAILVAFIILLVFHEVIVGLIDRFFIKPIFSHVHKSILLDVSLVILFVGIGVFFMKKLCRRYHVGIPLFLISLFSIVLYFIVRNDLSVAGVDGCLTPFYCFEKVKYMDVAMSIPFGNIILFIVFWSRYHLDDKNSSSTKENDKGKFCFKLIHGFQKDISANKPQDEVESELSDDTNGKPKILRYEAIDYSKLRLIVDDPIVRAEDNVLQWDNQLESMKNVILKTKSESAVAFGIVGEWGSGKTSFVNLLKEKLVNNNTVVVHFNPWMVTNGGSLVGDFFNVLKSELGKYSNAISNQLATYSRHLVSLDDNLMTKLIDISMNLFEDSDNQTRFNKIDETLRVIKKEVVVIIDDLDRMDSNEIMEVLKLIRNTANFKQFKYVVPYSRAYLLEAVKKVNIHNSERYIDKIFLYNHELRAPNYKEMRNAAERSLIIAGFKMPERELIKDHLFLDRTIEKIVPHFRDVKRFLNRAIVDFEFARNHLVFSNFISVKIIEYKYLRAYEILRDEKGNIFESKTDDGFNFFYSLKYRADKQITVFSERLIDEGYDSNERVMIEKIVERLFSSEFFESHKPKSIDSVHVFDRYFTKKLENYYIDEDEFYEKIIEKNSSVYLEEIVKNNKSISIIRLLRFVGLNRINKREDFENMVVNLFHWMNLIYKKKDSSTLGIINTGQMVLMDLFGRYRTEEEQQEMDDGKAFSCPEDEILTRYYRGSFESYNNFLLSVLTKDCDKCFEYFYVLKLIEKNVMNSFRPISKQNVERILYDRFEARITVDNLDWLSVTDSYLKCYMRDNQDNEDSKLSINPKAIDLMKRKINDDVQSFLEYLIRKRTRFSKNIVWYSIIEEYDNWFFEDHWTFLEELLENNDSLYVQQFRVFYNEYRKNNYGDVRGDFSGLLSKDE